MLVDPRAILGRIPYHALFPLHPCGARDRIVALQSFCLRQSSSSPEYAHIPFCFICFANCGATHSNSVRRSIRLRNLRSVSTSATNCPDCIITGAIKSVDDPLGGRTTCEVNR